MVEEGHVGVECAADGLHLEGLLLPAAAHTLHHGVTVALQDLKKRTLRPINIIIICIARCLAF